MSSPRSTVVSRSAQEFEPKQHEFRKWHFSKPTWCDFCSKFIWGLGKQGDYCKNCKYSAHSRCARLVKNSPCVPKSMDLKYYDAVKVEYIRSIMKEVEHNYLSEEEVMFLWQNFSQMFGKVATSQQLLEEFQSVTPKLAKHLMRVMDAGVVDGTLDFVEWLEVMAVVSRGTLDDKLDLTFRLFDENSDGLVSREEIHLLVNDMGEYLAKVAGREGGMLQVEEERLLRDSVITDIFSNEKEITLDKFKERSMRNKVVLNCYSIFEITFEPILSRMHKACRTLKIFGQHLHSLQKKEGRTVPVILDDAIEYISTVPRGMEVQGLFRVSGTLDEFMEIKGRLDKGERINYHAENISVLNVARIMKAFLRELPEPLLTFPLYNSFCSVIFEAFDEKEVQEHIATLVRLLPEDHIPVLSRVVKFLNEVASQSDMNKMTAYNLAVLFAPSFLRSRYDEPATAMQDMRQTIKVTEILINVPEIFEAEKKERNTLEGAGLRMVEQNVKLQREIAKLSRLHEAEILRLNQIIREKDEEIQMLRAHAQHSKVDGATVAKKDEKGEKAEKETSTSEQQANTSGTKKKHSFRATLSRAKITRKAKE